MEIVRCLLGTTSGCVVDITSVILDVRTVSKTWEEHWEWSAIHSTVNYQLYEALHISTSRPILLVRFKMRARRPSSDCSLTEVSECVRLKMDLL